MYAKTIPKWSHSWSWFTCWHQIQQVRNYSHKNILQVELRKLRTIKPVWHQQTACSIIKNLDLNIVNIHQTRNTSSKNNDLDTVGGSIRGGSMCTPTHTCTHTTGYQCNLAYLHIYANQRGDISTWGKETTHLHLNHHKLITALTTKH